MGMQDAVRSVFRNYATFSGRARRPEYWWFLLFSAIVGIVLGAIDGMLFGRHASMSMMGGYAFAAEAPSVLSGLWSLATLLPSLAVSVRRLHDIGRSGWWLLLILLPLIGFIVLLVWMMQKSDQGTNAYGPEPA